MLLYIRSMKWFLLFIITLSFFSCHPSPNCQKNQINPVFIGYTLSDIDTVIFRKYTLNSNFTQLLDTLLLDTTYAHSYAYRYTVTHDSTILSLVVDTPQSAIVAGYDWKIFVPAKNQTIFISGIENGAHTGAAVCSDPIASFLQDGRQVISPEYFGHNITGDSWWLNGYRAYIHLQ
jgi:hypothetical protein